MFDPDIHIDVPNGNLLAEIGIDPAAAREVIAEDRAVRCPDRDRVRPDPGTAFLDVAMPHDIGPREAASADIPVPACRQAGWS